jgi:hypothetical protein
MRRSAPWVACRVDHRSPLVVVAHALHQVPDRRAGHLRGQVIAGVPQVVEVQIRNSIASTAPSSSPAG